VATKALKIEIFKQLSLIGGTMQSVKVTKSHEEFLIDSLKDPEESADYLAVVLEEVDPETFRSCSGGVGVWKGSRMGEKFWGEG